MPSRRQYPADSSPRDGCRHAADWCRPLERLKTALIAARPADGDRYRHGVVWVEGELSADVARVNPRILSGGGRVRRAIPVNCPAGGHLVHYFFDDGSGDDGGAGLDLLARVVRRAASALRTVPQRVLPPFTRPDVADGLDEALLLWASLLHRLGRVEGNSAFRSTLEALPATDELSSWATFSDWDRFPVLPGFDPVPAMTGTAQDRKSLVEWRAEHRAAGLQLPKVIAASLSKPLWYASANAPDQILLLDRAAPQPVTNRTRHRADGVSADRRGDPYWELKCHIVTVLFEHHRPTATDPRDTPLTQGQIAERIEVDQSTVSRGLAALLLEVPCCQGKKPKKAYRDLCDTTGIHEVLIWLRLKYAEIDLRPLFTSANMDRLADTIKGAPEDGSDDGPED